MMYTPDNITTWVFLAIFAFVSLRMFSTAREEARLLAEMLAAQAARRKRAAESESAQLEIEAAGATD